MIYQGNKVTDINLAYIGGGSRGWAWTLMSDLAREEALSGTVRLYDIDIPAAKNNEIIGNRLNGREDVKGEWNYKAVESLEAALTGADFVVISILPATLKEMYSDVHAPEKYGILQPTGDTTGPGGIVRALRAIPMYIEIAEAIKKYAPNAWVISYTNPMTICMRTLYEVFPEIKAFGCCHEVFGTQRLIGYAISEFLGVESPRRTEILTNVLGINHFTWIDKVTYHGEDIMPIYAKFVDKYYEEGFRNTHRVKFDLFKRYGLIAAAGDRHLVEFLPGPWYLKDRETVAFWKFPLIHVQSRMDELEKRLARSKRLVNDEEPFELKASGEEGVRQIKALLGLGDLITNVNLPNRGQAPDLPEGAVVETNAVFSKDSVRPVLAGTLPVPVRNLVMRQVFNQETVVEAGFERDKELAFQAFVNDPLVNIDLKDAKALFDEMLENTKAYLPGYDV
ncbi:MAG TPA: alpha-glucosidase/alpha-galactosidase [Limnochordia bacterium]|nr:alpha-glucosidase/alpha-galactosidase [Bacillota bacterium]HKM16994.1 alpha-glucosidase/alpha-galactosidase [Limnochordia bacterium]